MVSYTKSTFSITRNRPDPAYPFELVHLYDYWELLRYDNGVEGFDIDGINCSQASSLVKNCQVRPRIKARDNWGIQTGWITPENGFIRVNR